MNKMKSRKLIVWICWTVLLAVSTIVTKSIDPVLMSWYGPITMVYIGGQAAIDTVAKLKEK